MVTENEKDYSDYVQNMLTSTLSTISLLSGFTFTAFTILLTLLPDPSNMISQFTLFFLAALFYLFMTLLHWGHHQIMRYSKNVPPLSKGINTFNFLILLSYMGLGTTIVLMLLIWNLIYLALATGVAWAIHLILTNTYIWKPLREYRKTIH